MIPHQPCIVENATTIEGDFIRGGMCLLQDGDEFTFSILDSWNFFDGTVHSFVGDRLIISDQQKVIGTHAGQYDKGAGCLIGQRFKTWGDAYRELRLYRKV